MSHQPPPATTPAAPAIAPPPAGPVEDGFDYSTVDAAAADELRRTAERIAARTRGHILATGRDLIAARAKLPHGAFGRWALAAVGMSERTARNYVTAAELVDAVPPAAREALVRRAMDGAAPSKEEVQAAAREAREAADPRHQAKLARQQAEAKARRARAKQRAKRWEAEEAARRAEKAKREAAARELAALVVRCLPAEALPEAERLLGVAGWALGDALRNALWVAAHGGGRGGDAGPEDAR